MGDKINLSNSPDTQSRTAEILAVGNNIVYVIWWKLNENVHLPTNESIMRVSTDARQTFGSIVVFIEFFILLLQNNDDDKWHEIQSDTV